MSQQRGDNPGDPADPVRPDPVDDAYDNVEYETEVAYYHRPLLGATWIAGLLVIPALLAAVGMLGRPGTTATPAPSSPPAAAAPSAAPSGNPSPGEKVPIFTIIQDGRTVTVTGSVPDATTRAAVLDAVKKGYDGTPALISDKLGILAEAPALDAAAFGELAAALKGVRGLTMDAQGGTVRVSGAATDEAAKAALLAAIGKAYPGKAVESAGIVVGDPAQAPASCDVTANYVAVVTAETKVNFGTGGSVLTADSQAALKKIADALGKCADLKVAVTGNTDNTGTDATNQKLSQTRADAVKDALVKLGVAADRITAEGVGSAKPLASNDTPTGRSINRRVDITVQ